MITFTPEQEQFMQQAQDRAYYRGLREGVEMYAHWRDGTQYVGTTGRTLKQALADIDEDETVALLRFDRLKQI